MIKEIEDKIVDAFIIKIKKERAKYELGNIKKRRYFLWSLPRYIDKNYANKITEPIKSYLDVYNILKQHGAPDTCYVMEKDDEIDGKVADLKEAIKSKLFYGPVLISCIHGKLAYLEEEQTIGRSDRYLLIHD